MGTLCKRRVSKQHLLKIGSKRYNILRLQPDEHQGRPHTGSKQLYAECNRAECGSNYKVGDNHVFHVAVINCSSDVHFHLIKASRPDSDNDQVERK